PIYREEELPRQVFLTWALRFPPGWGSAPPFAAGSLGAVKSTPRHEPTPRDVIRVHAVTSGCRIHLTKTHFGSRIGKAMRPTTAVAATSTGLLTWKRKRMTRLASAMRAVSQSPIAMRARSRQAPNIVPIAAA